MLAAALVAYAARVAAAAPICDALALCPAGVDPCTITGAKTIGEACTLDFGTRSITIVGNLTAERSGGSFSIQAGALTLTGSLLAVGSTNDLGGSITIDVTGAFVMATSGPRINVNGENGGGDVTVTAHSIDVDAGAPAISGRGTGTFGDGGTITLEAQDLLRVSGSLDVGGGGATSGGSVALTGASVAIDVAIDADGGGGDGGTIDVESNAGGISMTGGAALRANGGIYDTWGGYGGTMYLDAYGGDIVVDVVQADGAGPDGNGGYVSVIATGDVRFLSPLSVQGLGTFSSGGLVDVTAGGNLLLDAVMDAHGGGQGAGGFVSILGARGLTVTSAGRIMANGGLVGGNIATLPSAGPVRIDGALEARGTIAGANGGTISLGPHCTLDVTGTLDVQGGIGGSQGGVNSLAAGHITVGATGDLLAMPCAPGACGQNLLVLPPGTQPVVDPAATVSPPKTVTASSTMAPCCGNGTPDAGETCDDGNRNHCDGCSARCVVEPNPACPSNGNPCVVVTCDPALGCQSEPLSGTSCPDDGIVCTLDRCADGVCTHPANPCNDGIACTTDACSPIGGCTNIPNPAACDDGNPCTTDVCDTVEGCSALPLADGTICSDGNACSTGDRCVAGACVTQPSFGCDDGNPCTEDSCHPVLGCFQTELPASCPCTTGAGAAPAGTPCADGDECTVGETCNGAGQCGGGTPRDCNDGDPCTNDLCVQGLCGHADVACSSLCVGRPNGAPCSDHAACTTGSCQGGLCVNTPRSCDDGNPCTGTEFCIEGGFGLGCRNGGVSANQPCDDGNACTVGDVCHDTVCVPGSADPCPACEACDPTAGCRSAPRATCGQSHAPSKSTLQVKDRSADASDLLVWKWLQGDAAIADFGDPLGTGDQALCIWDGGQNLLWRGEAPAGGLCGSASCWKALGSKGYRYKDGAGTPDGLSGVLLGAGVGGKAKLQVKGKGALLAPPAPPFVLPVRVQLQSEGGRCWEAQYGTAGVLVNSAGAFKGKGQ